ncbi:hypothetical protein QCA50_012618 [Cerrena zonata]|uniref:HAMP domain-containing protein n=1 Tax=Cerrena zonata TaxID=2478898 RepID=A0AAW0G1N7_9APHY
MATTHLKVVVLDRWSPMFGSKARSLQEVTKAITNGDLSKTVDINVQGEMLELTTTVKQMVSCLSTLAGEATRVSLKVGTEGKIGSQSNIPNVQVLTDSVNLTAMNLTNQVHSIADVTKAIASDNFTKQITIDVRGEMLDLKEIVNDVTASLSIRRRSYKSG